MLVYGRSQLQSSFDPRTTLEHQVTKIQPSGWSTLLQRTDLFPYSCGRALGREPTSGYPSGSESWRIVFLFLSRRKHLTHAHVATPSCKRKRNVACEATQQPRVHTVTRVRARLRGWMLDFPDSITTCCELFWGVGMEGGRLE